MKKLNSYMNPFQKWKNRWKLRRLIVALEEQQEGMKKNGECLITVERQELDSFIRYMTSLHDSKLSRVMLARIALACLITRDEDTLKEPPQKIVNEAMASSGRKKSSIMSTAGKQLEMDL